jgi:hypothetical protein
MADHSNLGPIDPQYRGIPAAGVISEFKRIYREIKKDRGRISLWAPIVGQYKPTFLGQCENAVKWSKQFVTKHLEEQMFKGEKNASKKAKAITRSLSNYTKNMAHDRHIHMEECRQIGLKVERIEDDDTLQDLILTVHHAYMVTLMNTPALKIIENQNGAAFVKAIPVPQLIRQPIN